MFKVKKIQWYLTGSVLGLLAGALIYFVQPVKWKGEVLVSVGGFSHNTIQRKSLNRNFIEPLETVVERLKSRSFIQAVAERGKRNGIAALLNVNEGAGMTIKRIRNSDSLKIIVIGAPSELVQAAIEGILAEIVSKHDAILKASIADSQKVLARIDSEIDVLLKRIAMAEKMQSEGREVLVQLLKIIATSPLLKFKLDQASSLREDISNWPTSALEPPSISEWRIFSSLWRACLFGALLGMLLSAIWIRWKK
jgi:hypothetical protein